VVDTPYIPAENVVFERRPTAGYVMVVCAAVLFGLNGVVSKVALEGGLSSFRVAQGRCLGALVILAALLLAARPGVARARPGELPFLVVFGCCGVVITQLTYFLAIQRLDIGVALLIIFLAPVLVALWARFVYEERVRRRVWAALALALVGLSLVVEVWGGVSLDSLGIVFALLGVCSVAAYLLLAEHAVGRRDPLYPAFRSRRGIAPAPAGDPRRDLWDARAGRRDSGRTRLARREARHGATRRWSSRACSDLPGTNRALSGVFTKSSERVNFGATGRCKPRRAYLATSPR
jgi:uncharacterized membrane protein